MNNTEIKVILILLHYNSFPYFKYYNNGFIYKLQSTNFPVRYPNKYLIKLEKKKLT